MNFLKWSLPARDWIARHWFELLVLVAGFVVMHLVLVFDAPAFFSRAIGAGAGWDFTKSGPFGDFIGGYIGTFFALVSVVFLLATLRSQRTAAHLQSFENRYFELIKLHRDNVAEFELQGTFGRRAFVLILREYRALLDIARQVANRCDQTLTSRQLSHIAYYCLFFGTGPNSTRMLKLSLSEFDKSFLIDLVTTLDSRATKLATKRARRFKFVPFEGHQSRLGHYYRHLYQTVGYVDKQRLPDAVKYEYVKTIRAQLSTHEQALLLLNSLSPIGHDWWSKGYILKYRMVQNLPRHFFDPSELDLDCIFPRPYFEWEARSAA